MARCQLHRCDARKSFKSRANSILDGNGLATAFHRHHHTNESRHSPHLPPYVSHPLVFQYLIHHPIGIFPSKLNRWFCYIMLLYTVSQNIACFFVTLFQCSYVLPYSHLSHNLSNTLIDQQAPTGRYSNTSGQQNASTSKQSTTSTPVKTPFPTSLFSSGPPKTFSTYKYHFASALR